jgi:hypothetical protein
MALTSMASKEDAETPNRVNGLLKQTILVLLNQALTTIGVEATSRGARVFLWVFSLSFFPSSSSLLLFFLSSVEALKYDLFQSNLVAAS